MLRTPSLILASLSIVVAPAIAQSGITLVGGFVSANISYEEGGESDNDSFASRTGFAIGLGVQRQLGTSLSFAPEALYVVKGTKDPDSDANIKFGYLEVPLLVRYSFGNGGDVNPFVTVGPTVSFQISCDVNDDGGESESCDDTFGEDETIESMDYGVMVGAGVQFNRFGLSARYEMGLKDINKADFLEAKNKALMILGSYAF
jgi:opacity protein-like surface antigen